MFLTTYAPKNTEEFIGNKSALMEIKKFIAHWRKGQALLVHGPPGTGKTTAVRLIAKETGAELVESHPGERLPVEASGQRSIFSKKKIILIEDVGATSMRRFSELLKKSSHPVLCTTADAYKLPPATRKNFRLVKFDKVGEKDLVSLGKRIGEMEQITTDEKQLAQLAKQSNGDARSFLIDLETLFLGTAARLIGYRNFEENVFSTMRVIFKTMSIENAKIAMENSGKDAEEIFYWLDQNIKEEYNDIHSIARAYDYLSKSDIFHSRIIRRQSWSLMKYAAIAVYGTALAKQRPSARFVSYMPPFIPRKANRSALKKIAAATHSSPKVAIQYIQIIRANPQLCERLDLDDKELDFVMGY